MLVISLACHFYVMMTYLQNHRLFPCGVVYLVSIYTPVGGIRILNVPTAPAHVHQPLSLPILLGIQQIVALRAESQLGTRHPASTLAIAKGIMGLGACCQQARLLREGKAPTPAAQQRAFVGPRLHVYCPLLRFDIVPKLLISRAAPA